MFSGKVRCLVDGVQVAIYKPGDAMGQTALDGATPRTATLIAATVAQILRLESDDYKFTMEVRNFAFILKLIFQTSIML